jgi:hypothetical protein
VPGPPAMSKTHFRNAVCIARRDVGEWPKPHPPRDEGGLQNLRRRPAARDGLGPERARLSAGGAAPRARPSPSSYSKNRSSRQGRPMRGAARMIRRLQPEPAVQGRAPSPLPPSRGRGRVAAPAPSARRLPGRPVSGRRPSRTRPGERPTVGARSRAPSGRYAFRRLAVPSMCAAPAPPRSIRVCQCRAGERQPLRGRHVAAQLFIAARPHPHRLSRDRVSRPRSRHVAALAHRACAVSRARRRHAVPRLQI